MAVNNSISDELYDSIRNKILDVEFFPGEKISENFLANYYDVSRTPIKNALIRLEGEGLVDVISQKGTYVKKLSISNLKEILTIRCYIEAMVVLNEPSINDEFVINELRNNLEQQNVLIQSDQKLRDKVHAFFQLDNEFHYLVFKLYSKENLWNYIMNNFPQLKIYRVLSILREKEFLIEKVDEHRELFHCISNEEKKGESLKQYVNHIFGDDFKDFEIARSNFPEYFTE